VIDLSKKTNDGLRALSIEISKLGGAPALKKKSPELVELIGPFTEDTFMGCLHSAMDLNATK
jgi:hypothetical protein